MFLEASLTVFVFIAGYEVCQVRLAERFLIFKTLANSRKRELEQGLVPEWRVKYFDYKVEPPLDLLFPSPLTMSPPGW